MEAGWQLGGNSVAGLQTTTVRIKQKNDTMCDVCPSAVATYNKYMGGVNKGDQYRGYYNVCTNSTKCYRYIFWFLFEAS